MTIGNFLKCSCVYFVTMLVGSLGGRRVYMQCKHVYHVFVNDHVLWAHGRVHSSLHKELG